jgi:hypothetical protein
MGLSYQLSFTESNFKVFCNVSSVARSVKDREMTASQEFPQFPFINNIETFDYLSDIESEKSY